MKSYPRSLYIDNAKIYQPILEAGIPKAPSDAAGIDLILRQFGKISPRARILDVSCGIGRHSIALASLGYQVVGIDFSPYFIRKARNLTRKQDPAHRPKFYVEDTRNLISLLRANREPKFDGIICIDSAFVRDSRKEEIELLRSLLELANDKCILIIETACREYVINHPDLYSSNLEFVQNFPKSKLERHVRFGYDQETRMLRTRWRFMQVLRSRDLKHLLTINFELGLYR